MSEFDVDAFIKKQYEKDDMFESLKRRNHHRVGNRWDGK